MKVYKLLSDKYSVLVGSILTEDCFMKEADYPVSYYVEKYPADWEQVLEIPIKEPEGFLDRMHKETDLGYYAGLFASNGCDPSVAIFRAKELIKQLDQEIK